MVPSAAAHLSSLFCPAPRRKMQAGEAMVGAGSDLVSEAPELCLLHDASYDGGRGSVFSPEGPLIS